jgi:hypothetical protein
VSDQSSPLDALLDLFVYAPVGLALLASEELPKLAARGRAQLGGQLTVAKVVGQFAVGPGSPAAGVSPGAIVDRAPPFSIRVAITIARLRRSARCQPSSRARRD